MVVYITKHYNGKYRYLANWINPDTGAMMGDWFESLDEIEEYTKDWNPQFIRVNF